MPYKIFTSGNYIVIQDIATEAEYEGLKREVKILKLHKTSTSFRFENFNNWEDPLNGVDISDIKKENGDAYTLNEFVTFRNDNTGNFNSPNGGATIGTTPLVPKTSIRPVATATDTDVVSEKAVRTELDKKADSEIDSTGFGAAGSEKTLGLNTTHNTIQKVFDKIKDYTAAAVAVLVKTKAESVTDEDSGAISGKVLNEAISNHVAKNHEKDDVFHAAAATTAENGKFQTVAAGKVVWGDVPEPKKLTDAEAMDATKSANTDAGLVNPKQLSLAVEAFVKDILGVSPLDKDLGTFTGVTIGDDSTIKAALQSLETGLESLKITGRYIGSSTTFNTLPTTSVATGAAVNGDIVSLTAVDGVNQKGIYMYNGTAYSLVLEVLDIGLLTATQIENAASTVSGTVSGELINAAIANHVSQNHEQDDLFHAPQASTAVNGMFQGVEGGVIKWLDVIGRVTGKTATFAGLSTTAKSGDLQILDTTDGTNQRGFYRYNGTAWSLYLSVQDIINDSYSFASSAEVTVSVVGTPSLTEIKTWADSKTPNIRGRHIYYTGTALATDVETYIWFIDGSGIVKSVKEPINNASGIINLSTAFGTTIAIGDITNDGTYFITANSGLNNDNSGYGIPQLPAGSTLTINGVNMPNATSGVTTVWNQPYTRLTKTGNNYAIVNVGLSVSNVHDTRTTTLVGALQGSTNTDKAQGRTAAWQCLNNSITLLFDLSTASTFQTLVKVVVLFRW
jgi:hypothetical protein